MAENNPFADIIDEPARVATSQDNPFADITDSAIKPIAPRFVPQGVPREEKRPEPGFLSGLGAGLEAGVSGVAETAEAAINQARGQPIAEPTEITEPRPGKI